MHTAFRLILTTLAYVPVLVPDGSAALPQHYGDDPGSPWDLRMVAVEVSEQVGGEWVPRQPATVPENSKLRMTCRYAYTTRTGQYSKAFTMSFVNDMNYFAAIEPFKASNLSSTFDWDSHQGWRHVYFDAPSLGTHSVGCALDPLDELGETDESNNKLFRQLWVVKTAPGGENVVGTVKPEVAAGLGGYPFGNLHFHGDASFGAWHATKGFMNGRTISVGDAVDLKCHYYVRFTEPPPASSRLPAWTVHLERDGQVWKEFRGIRSGKSVLWDDTVVFTWIPTRMGKHTFRCTLDPDNRIAESYEADNTAELTIRVVDSVSRSSDLPRRSP
jgi:hypothetical protein